MFFSIIITLLIALSVYGYGVYAQSNRNHALYARSEGDATDYAGYFSGPYGIHVDNNRADTDAITVVCDGGGNCHGLDVLSITAAAIYANTYNSAYEYQRQNKLIHRVVCNNGNCQMKMGSKGEQKPFSFYQNNKTAWKTSPSPAWPIAGWWNNRTFSQGEPSL